MTADPLERLRSADPAAEGGNAPPFETVMANVRASGELPGGEGRRAPDRTRSDRPAWTRALRPGLGVAAALGVIAVIVFAVARHGAGPSTPTAVTTGQHPSSPVPAVPAPSSLVPRHGGMRGVVVNLYAFGAGLDLTADFDQCATCTTRFRANDEARWTARSTDGGQTWRVGRPATPAGTLGEAAQSGRTIWSTGSRGNAPAVFVSHDDGQTYTAADTAATPSADSALTIDDGTVWALGNRCTGGRCHGVVLSGPVGGGRLVATATQPALRPHRNYVDAVLSAHGPDVYITGGNDTTDLQTFASHDGGRSWTQVTYPCARPVEGIVEATGSQSLWAMCLGSKTIRRSVGSSPAPEREIETIRRSSDGGHHWTTTPASLAVQGATLDAVSDQVAWLVGQHGAVQRTSDGGQTWQTVLQVPASGGNAPQLTVRDAETATVVVAAIAGSVTRHDRRTELVAYRTSDGGVHWTPTVIHLPSG